MYAAAALSMGVLPCAAVALRPRSPIDRLVGLEMAAVLECLLLVLLCEAMHRPLFLDVALALALLAFGGGLVFTRFLERWL
jgi:multisubunit Na+/H+ antiporter MnhF subunit